MAFQLLDNLVFSKSPSSELDPSALNIWVLQASQVSKLSKLANGFVKERMHEQLKKLAPSQSSGFVLALTEGGSVAVMLLKDKATAFETATLIRTTLSPALKSFSQKNLLFRGDFLPGNKTLGVFGQLVSFLHMESWKIKKISSEKKSDSKTFQLSFTGKAEKSAVTKAFKEALTLAKANNLVRDLSESPPNVLNPVGYLKKIRELVSAHKGIKLDFLDEKRLEKMGAGAFLAVSAASPGEGAGIAHLHYKKSGMKTKGHLALVGKGLCFDTGGYNVKPETYMRGMKRDMTGSAVALAVLLAIVELGLPIEVDAYLAISENHISPSGFKADEVVTALNKKTIEIVHTDAEGRMVLADTLHLASLAKPDLILDFATLTGSVRRALDGFRSGVYSNREALLREAYDAGESSGERVWPFPSGEDYREPLKSEIADLLQCLEEGMADHIYAATFLREFVGEDVPWVHMDLAASSSKNGLGAVSSKVTGFGTYWSMQMIRSHFALKA